MIARTAFNQLRHSFWLLLGTIVGMLLIYVLPLALIVSGSWKLAIIGAACVWADVRDVLADGAVLRVGSRVGVDAAIQRGLLQRRDRAFRN